MRRAVLVGNPGSKRTRYLRQAAEQTGIPLCFADWRNWRKVLPPEGPLFVKIDPPLWESCRLARLEGLAADYRKQLEELSEEAGERCAAFLNHPSAIVQLLNKRACKEKLRQAGLAVTEELARLEWTEAAGQRTAALLEAMRREGLSQVFIKPAWGSGAAGVSALRRQSAGGRMALYTCALVHPELGLVNTKRLRRFTRPDEIFCLLESLLELDCVVERWYAKADYEGFAYDLRVVVQDGRTDFVLARLSKGPITNLHLNNRPLDAAALRLPVETMALVNDLCRRAMNCFPGLRSAGIDILLEKGSLTPRIIEMNAQGDLIYRDIERGNVIYRHQAEMMKAWLAEAGQEDCL